MTPSGHDTGAHGRLAMIVWQGLGAAAFVIPFGVMLLFGLVGPAPIGQATFAQYGRIIVGASLLVGAVLVYLLAKRLALVVAS